MIERRLPFLLAIMRGVGTWYKIQSWTAGSPRAATRSVVEHTPEEVTLPSQTAGLRA